MQRKMRFLVILLIYTTMIVHSQTCNINQTICGNHPDTWCCSNGRFCGNAQNLCTSPVLTDSSYDSTNPVIYAVAISLSISVCCILLRCWLRQQAQQRILEQSTYSVPAPQSRLMARNQQVQRTPVVVGARPPAAIPVPPTYEEAPPSYDDVVKESPYHGSTATNEQANLRV